MSALPGLVRRLAPSAASASQRASQLVVLWALTAASTGMAQAQLVTGFGLIATFVMISDSGAGNFLLARSGDRLTRAAYARAAGVHLCCSLVGVTVCAGFLAVVLERPVSGGSVLVLLALGLTQLEDNLSRVIRYPLLSRGDDVAFAWPELTCSVLKIGLAGWAGASSDLRPLLGLPLVSLLVILLAVRPVRAALHPSTGTPPAVRAILVYGLAGAISSTYSQLPLIFASLVLSNSHAAVLATLMRVFQALEIVPGTISLQLMPRYAQGRRDVRGDWVRMSAGALLLAVVFLPFVPLVGRLLSLPLGLGLAVLLAGSFVARCGGYVLSSFAMGTDRIDLRLRLTVLAAAVMLPVTPLLVLALGIEGGGIAALTSEVLLAAGLAVRLRADGPPAPVGPSSPVDVDDRADPAPVSRLSSPLSRRRGEVR